MTASVGNIVLYILFLWIAPVFVGNAICNRLSMRGTIPRSFVMGYLSMWAVFQIITVSLILLKVSFLVDVVVYSIFLVGIIAYGIVKKTYRSMTIPKVEPSAWVGIIVMLATGIYMIVQSFRLQLTNADDTRFVVNAVDTVRTNRMLLTDVNTGKEILSWTGDLFKDVISPWAVFAAYLSKITGISAASMMHTFLPPVLLAVMMCIFWLIAGELFDKHIYRSLFVILLLVMYMYGYFSIYNAEQKGAICMVWLTVFAVALLTSMSYILSTVMIGCFGFVYGIAKKSLRTAIMVWGTCLVNIAYLGISTLLH